MKRLNAITIAGLFVCSLWASVSLGDNSADGKLYIASKIYTMDGAPISPGQVLVVDGKIKAVGEKIELNGSSPDVIDLGEGSVLMPGLVDAYSQTPLSTSGIDEITSEITPDFRVVDSIDWEKSALRRQLHSGTTTMCVCPGTQNVFAGIAAIVKTDAKSATIVSDNGPLLTSLCADPASRNQSRARPDSIFVRQPTNRMGVVWILRKTFAKVQNGDDPNALSTIRQTLAGERQLMVVSRISHDLNTIATLADEFGLSPIIVGGQEAHKVKEMLADRKYPVILQPIATESVRGREGSEVCWNQAGVLATAGVPFALSGNNLLEQARFAHRHGLERDLALSAITSTPAQLLKIEDRVGTITAGKDADLLALNGEPLELTTSVRWVMVNGKTIENNKEN